MQDKIAEHIAKFNAPEDAEFYWVSDCENLPPEIYMNNMDLSFLALKLPSGKFKHISGYDFFWQYTLKHEQKGEQMKSIELSEEEEKHLKIFIGIADDQLGGDSPQPHLTKSILSKLENAKPAPTEPRFSLDEIKEATKIWAESWVDKLLEDLKTPKPRLRDRNFKEKLIWLSEQNFPEHYVFKKDLESEDRLQLSEFSKYYNVGLNPTDPWLPIPPIEIESEK